MEVTVATLGYVREAQWRLGESVVGGMGYEVWRVQVEHYKPLIERVIEQTERRVFAGETVPAREKLVSVFEPHTDIIKKSNRETRYGHKLNLSSGRSGLILDVVVEEGNPSDSETACIPFVRLAWRLETSLFCWLESKRKCASH